MSIYIFLRKEFRIGKSHSHTINKIRIILNVNSKSKMKRNENDCNIHLQRVFEFITLRALESRVRKRNKKALIIN